MATGLGIDLGASAVKVVKVRRRGGAWQILRAWRVADPSPPPPPVRPGKVVELPPRVLPPTARAEFKKAGLSGRGALGVTGRDLMVKYVATPPVPPWKLQMMMDLEIKGTSGADICGDHATLALPGDLTREMVSLVAVARTEYVERQMSLAVEAGLSAEWCCPNAVALFNAFLASAQYRPGETTAVLDIGRDNLELVIQSDGVLYFARSAAGGGRQFTDAIDGLLKLGYDKAEGYKTARAAILADGSGAGASDMQLSGALCEVADGLAAALRSATMFCRAQAKLTRLNLERIVLSGGGARLEGLAEYLSEKAGVPADVLDPASRMDISSLPAGSQALFDGRKSAEMSVALGLAMAAADESLFHLRVVPDKVLAARKFWRGTAWAIAAAALLAGLLAVDIVGANRRRSRAEELRWTLETKLKDKQIGLEKKLADFKKDLAATGLLTRRAKLLVAPSQRNVPVLGFLKLLREATPDGIVLEKLSASRPEAGSRTPADQVEVRVEGYASKEVLAVENVFEALEDYRKKLLTDSRKLAFKIDDPLMKAGDAAGPRGLAFTLTARIFTLGVEEMEEEVEEGAGPASPEAPEEGPVIVPGRPRPPGYLPTKPSPFKAPERKPAPSDGGDDEGPGGKKNAFDGGGRQ